MNKKGIIKHKVVFDAWLAGATIEQNTQCPTNSWEIDTNPQWDIDIAYRVIAKVKRIKVWVGIDSHNRMEYFNDRRMAKKYYYSIIYK